MLLLTALLSLQSLAAASSAAGRTATASSRSLAHPAAPSCIRHTDAQAQAIDEEGGLPLPCESRESPAKKRRPQPLLAAPRELLAPHAQGYLRLSTANAMAKPAPSAWPDTAQPPFARDAAQRRHRGQAPPLA